MRSSCPSFHACWITGILVRLATCAFTLSSVSRFSFSSWLCTSWHLFLPRTYLMQDSQASSGPWSCFWKAALMPPHPQWPVTMMSLTLSTCTEYCTTARRLMSEGGAWLATFLCTKSSPGFRPTISLAGTRESAHPIQRYSGFCSPSRLEKNSGSFFRLSQAHSLLLFMMRYTLNGVFEADSATTFVSNCILIITIRHNCENLLHFQEKAQVRAAEAGSDGSWSEGAYGRRSASFGSVFE